MGISASGCRDNGQNTAVPTFARGHLLCAEAGPDQAPGEDACATRVRGGGGASPRCPMCRIALPPAENAIRALSAEQSIAALPWVCRHCCLDTTRGRAWLTLLATSYS